MYTYRRKNMNTHLTSLPPKLSHTSSAGTLNYWEC